MFLNETYERISRCKSLLDELESHQKEPNKFDALLESFTDCLRSITWIFQKEYKNKYPELDDWYKKKQIEMKKPENSLLNFFIKARNLSTKEKPLTLYSRAYFRELITSSPLPGWIFRLTSRGEPILISNPNTSEEIRIYISEYTNSQTVLHYFENPQIPESLNIDGVECSQFDALTQSKLYFNYLLSMIKEAEELLS